ncbi:MAG: hypothetical protein K0B01_13520 [Syntrophobacterales bacterium]|nr:hypothetical protein [Syntrophobacterales bacterium]
MRALIAARRRKLADLGGLVPGSQEIFSFAQPLFDQRPKRVIDLRKADVRPKGHLPLHHMRIGRYFSEICRGFFHLPVLKALNLPLGALVFLNEPDF